MVQLNNEFGGAHRQYAFPRMGLWMTDPVPEKFYKIGKRFSRNTMAELNDSRYVRFRAHMRVRVHSSRGFSKGLSSPVEIGEEFRANPSPEGRGCREAAGEGYHKKDYFMRYPSPGPSGHPLPSGEGFAQNIFQFGPHSLTAGTERTFQRTNWACLPLDFR